MGDLRLLGLTLLVLTSCGHGDERIDTCLDLCPKMVDCGLYSSAEACEQECHVYIFSAECLEGISAATCATLPAASDACFPACTSEQHCIDDVVVGCIGAREMMIRCNELCLAEGMTYSGTCGKELDGYEPSDVDVCWCIKR